MRNNPLFLIGEPWMCGSENREADPALLDWDDTVSVLSPFHEVDCHMSCTFRYCFEIQLYPCKFFLKTSSWRWESQQATIQIGHLGTTAFLWQNSHTMRVSSLGTRNGRTKGIELCLKTVNAIPFFLSLPLTVSK